MVKLHRKVGLDGDCLLCHSNPTTGSDPLDSVGGGQSRHAQTFIASHKLSAGRAIMKVQSRAISEGEEAIQYKRKCAVSVSCGFFQV